MEEPKICSLCYGCIPKNAHHLYRYNKFFYYHPFCYTRVTLATSIPIKNPFYKSLNSSSLVNSFL